MKDTMINPFTLKFSNQELENEFILEFNKQHIKISRIGFIMTLFMFVTYGIIDPEVYPAHYKHLWVLRFFTLLMIGIYFAFSYQERYFHYLQKYNLSFYVIAVSVLLLFFTYPIQTEYVYVYYTSFGLAIIGAFTCIGLLFFNALVISVIFEILALALFLTLTDNISFYLYLLLFISLHALIIQGSYFSQLNSRKLFLEDKLLQKTFDELSETKTKLEIQANQDYMTGLHNRRYLKSISETVMIKAKHSHFIILLFDIDHFKSINDKYGHDIGDIVIITIAKLAKTMLGTHDFLFRMGGEEFLMILQSPSNPKLTFFAEELRKLVENQSIITNKKNHIYTTISIGVSSIDLKKDTSVEDAIHRADNALYEAKRGGRNKVVVHQ